MRETLDYRKDLTYGERYQALRTMYAAGEPIDVDEARNLRDGLRSFIASRSVMSAVGLASTEELGVISWLSFVVDGPPESIEPSLN